MPYPTLADPVAGTVITAAWEIANPLAAIRWIRQLMGNADPPAGSLALVSSSTSTGSWAKVPSDALAPGVAVANLGYIPVNPAVATNFLVTPTVLGNPVALLDGSGRVNDSQQLDGIDSTGYARLAAASNFTVQPSYLGNSIAYYDASGRMFIVGLTLSGSLVAASAQLGAGGVNVTGGGGYNGGSTAVGNPSVLGLSVGGNGVAVSGAGGVNVTGGGGYNGGSTTVGIPSVLGANVGGSGIATAGPVASSVAAGSPYTAVSGAVCTGVNADMTDGAHASSTPGAGRIPIADASGKLDAWITPGGATVPSGAIVAFNALASLTAAGAGWTRHTAADGRLLVGDGTTFGQAFSQGGSYGASWAHDHSTPAHAHSGSSLSVSGTTGPASGSGNQANVATPNPASATQAHTHDQGNLDVAGSTATDGASTAGSTTWLPAMLGVVWGRKL